MDEGGAEDVDGAGEWEGAVDLEGNWCGRGTLWLSDHNHDDNPRDSRDGARWEGKMRGGERTGRGVEHFEDGASVAGVWHDGVLEGPGVYTSDDGDCIEGTFVHGAFEGGAREWSHDHELQFEGQYVDGAREGPGTAYLPFESGTLAGVWRNGAATGDGFAFTYPGGGVQLVGSWLDGEMVRAVVLRDGGGGSSGDGDRWFHADVATAASIATEPLLADPYEEGTVDVRPSTVCRASGTAATGSAGEGLFAKRAIKTDELCAYYSGTRSTHAEVDARPGWDSNSNTMSLAPHDDVTVIDVPPPWDALEHYCATLGHKANHAAEPNAEYRHVTHPRFGHIKSIWAIKDIAAGDEILVEYGYTDECPSWFTPDLYGKISRAAFG